MITILPQRCLLVRQKNSPKGLKRSLSSNHYRQITHESPSGGFRNHKSKAIWKMAKPLYIYCVCVRVCKCTASGHIVMPFWTAALILMSLSTPWPTWPSTGLFSTAGRYRRSAEGTARGLHTDTHTHLNTYKHGNTIASPQFSRAARCWKHQRRRRGINLPVCVCVCVLLHVLMGFPD